ncbi:hypothetical protein MMC30_004280 [Trapelia coarctata]|nr:hypothetical protein [Trapelia coarctata]
MDGLSVAASVISVLQLTLQLTSAVIGYLNDVKDAPKECQQCTIEISNLQSLLITLRYRLQQGKADDPWFTSVRALNIENGPLDQFKQALEQLLSRVEIQDGGVQEIKRRLLWKFKKGEVFSILARIERLKTLVILALGNDHFKLSQAIKDDTLFARDNIPILQTNIETIRDTQGLQLNTQKLQLDVQKLQQHQTIMQWLSPTDFPAQQHDIISRRQKDTGQWFLDSPVFKGWLQGADKILFCPGIPGAGKTMMAAIAIDHLGRLAQADVGLAYVFCNYKSQANQGLYDLLSALLKQLVQSRTDIAAPVTRLYDHHFKQKSRPSLDEISTALSTICLSHARVYVVVDALDECTDQDRTRNQLVEKLRELQTRTNVQLLFTSRFIPEITEKFRLDPVLEIRASEKDIERFVAGQIPRLPSCIRRDNELTRALAYGTIRFLLARLYVDSLLDKRTKQKVLSTLKKLSEGTATLENAYSDAIERIDGQLAEDRSLARRTISWISYAQRPLITQELYHALAIELGDRALNGDNIYDVTDIISVCAGLVTVDEESNVIRLVHYTTQDYFECIRLDWNPDAREEIATTCLTYLAFDIFRSGSCSSDENLEKRMGEYAFLDYAAQHWADHVRPVEATVSKLALAFLQDNALVSSSMQIMWTGVHKYKGYSQGFPKNATGLHLSATFGLVTLSRMLLTAGGKDPANDIDSVDSYNRTPLSWAAKNGHEAVVKLLIDTGKVDVDSKDDHGRTPLSWAAENGHEAVVKLLIDTGKVDVDSKDDYNQTPLSWAAKNGHEAVVKLLIDTGKVDVDSKDDYGRTPLSWAAENGHEAVVKLLIDTGRVDVDFKDDYNQTPLSWAAEKGHEAVVKLLIDTGKVDVDSKDDNNQTPLSWAAENGHEAVVKLLIDTGKVDVDSKDDNNQTPLSWAAGNGHEAMVKLLIDTGKVDVDSKDKSGRTPLSWAAGNGHEAMVKLLIDTGKVDVDSKDDYNRTPLSWAAGNGHEAVVKLLIDTGKVDVDFKDDYGRTPLSWAAGKGHEAVVKLLIDTGKVDVDFKDDNNQTPLSWAAENGHEAMVKLLIDTGKVDVDFKDDYGRTPLSWAAENGHEAMVKLLIDTGKVDVDFKDDYGRTPLSWAAENGHEAMVKLLIDTGKVDVDFKDDYNQTPLSWAAGKGHEAVVKLLIDTGKVDVDFKDDNNQTPLSWAVKKGHEAVVKLLIDTGKVDVDFKDDYNRTPLSWAAGKGHEAVVKLLIDTGKVDVDSKDDYNRTPLSWAAEKGYEAVVKLLIDTGKVDVDFKDDNGQTPLSWAAGKGHEAVVKLLIDTGKVDVDSKDDYGQTPLSWAAEKGHEAVVKLLIDTGKVDVDSKDDYGRTPLSWAAENGHEAVVKLLTD